MEGIAYQNKDVTSKVVDEEFPNKSLEVYGVDSDDKGSKIV